jgi:hypothetical protein
MDNSPVGRLLYVIAIAALLLGTVGCGTVPTPQEPEQAGRSVARAEGVLQVGVLGPSTEPSESMSNEFKYVANVAFEAVDWRIGEYRVEQVWIDSQSDPDSAAGLAYDGTNIFIEIAQHALEEHGELSSRTIYAWARENLQKGNCSYTDGIVMERYKYTQEILPDPVVGESHYMFPVLQYVDGEGKIIYPPNWAEQEPKPKP